MADIHTNTIPVFKMKYSYCGNNENKENKYII